MNTMLLRKLIEKNIIMSGITEIDVKYKGVDIGGNEHVPCTGTFIILDWNDKEDYFDINVANILNGSRRTIQSTNIILIDGMKPSRLGPIYGLSSTGEKVIEGKRRGRKPKLRLVDDEFEDDFDDDDNEFDDIDYEVAV